MSSPDLRLVAEVTPLERESTHLTLFHRVNSLVPDRQALTFVPPDAKVGAALEMMVAQDFSQLPVMAGSEVLGLFSYRSLGRRAATSRRSPLADHEVEDLSDEPVYARVTDELRDILLPLDRDGAVLVGDPGNLLAVVTPTDVTAYLFEVTQPFILLQEIERSLRSLVSATCPGYALPERIGAAVKHEYKGREERLPKTLEELTLGQLVAVVLNRSAYEDLFRSLLGNRDSAREKLEPLNEIRNAVLHFRRDASDLDLEQLQVARTWLLRKARRASSK